MAAYTHEVKVTWGESDPFGIVYYPCILAWFNDAEHELFRQIGYPIDTMLRDTGTSFVMGDIHFRFVGPAAYGDRVSCSMELQEIRRRTLHWRCRAVNAASGQLITTGEATRVHARRNDDGSLTSVDIPEALRQSLAGLLP